MRTPLLGSKALSTIVTLGIFFVPPVLGADGDVDLSFAADVAVPGDRVGLGVFRGEYYFSSVGQPVRRLRADGSLDPDWSLPIPSGSGLPLVEELAPTPWGSWVLRTESAAYHDPGTGSAQRIGFPASSSAYVQRLFPQETDWIVLGQPVSRVSLEGLTDPAYSSRAGFTAASFADGAGLTQIGGPWTTAIRDSLGRLIAVGNFKQVSDLPRLGLVRIRPDGSPDPAWDPALALGIELDGSGYLNTLPISLAPGAGGRVVVGLRFKSTNGLPNLGFAVLEPDGTVGSTFPNPDLLQPATPVVEPDGRVLFGGTLTGTPGSPLPVVLRLMADGSVDPSFHVELSSASTSVSVEHLALDEQGRLWITGQFDSVNGVARTNVARVFAYEPTLEAPSLAVSYHQPRIGTNEFLHLTATVQGVPQPALQWFLNGLPVAGQTNRGLRVLVQSTAVLGDYSLVASNSSGVRQLDFPPVALAPRSPVPGTVDPTFDRSLVQFVHVTHLLPLPDGCVLVGGGDLYTGAPFTRNMVGKLQPDGTLDPAFGDAGVVAGDGFVDSLRVLPSGAVLVAGEFTALAGAPAAGIAELNAAGRLVPRNWPTLDVAHVSTALRLPDGRTVVAGRFNLVGGAPAHRLARLNADLTLDTSFSSPLEPWQFVDDLQLDDHGRLLIAGSRNYVLESMTNPPPAGLQRLLEDGAKDPTFQRLDLGVRSVTVESGSLLAFTWVVNVTPGVEVPQRLDIDGAPRVVFDSPGIGTSVDSRPFYPDHRSVRLPNGAVMGHLASALTEQLVRWLPNGQRDTNFLCRIRSSPAGPQLQAVGLLPDGAVLASIMGFGNPEESRRLVRIPPDSDSRINVASVTGGNLQVLIATQPGRVYQIRRRTTLGSGAPEVVATVQGDGYVQQITTPASDRAVFIDYVRD